VATPIIDISGTVSGPGGPGQDRVIAATELITLTDTEAANVGATYQWAILDSPIGSSVALIGDTTPAPTFTTPAVGQEGTVRIQCTVDGVDTAKAHCALLLPNTLTRIPAFGERDGIDGWNAGGNTLGWHEAMTTAFRAIDSAVASGGGNTGLEMIATETVGIAVSSVTFAGLDGDVDDTYELVVDWVSNAAGDQRLAIQPNGLQTNQVSVWTVGGGVIPTSSNQSRMIVAVSPSKQHVAARVLLTAASGNVRKAVWNSGAGTFVAPANYTAYNGYAVWTDTAANITSLTLNVVTSAGATVAFAMQPGTRISLYRVAR
jgi:hypothetical protein